MIGRSDARHRGDGQDGDSTPTSGYALSCWIIVCAATILPLLESENISHCCISFRSSLLDGDLANQTDVEDIQTLQFMQWTTPQFCAAVLEKLLPCLKTPDERLVLHSFELLHQVAALLMESVAQNTLWEDGSLPARELVSFPDFVAMYNNITTCVTSIG